MWFAQDMVIIHGELIYDNVDEKTENLVKAGALITLLAGKKFGSTLSYPANYNSFPYCRHQILFEK